MKNDAKKIEISAGEKIVAEEIGTNFIVDVYGAPAGYFDLPLFDQEKINGYTKIIVSTCKGTKDQPELDMANIKVCNVVPKNNEIWVRLYISDQIDVFRLNFFIIY